MKSKLYTIIIPILLLSCFGKEDKTTEEKEISRIEKIDSFPEVVSDVEKPDSTFQSLEEFNFPEPNIAQISLNAQSSGNSYLYEYLVLNFDSLGLKILKETSGNYRYDCEFSQTFSEGIIYYQRECSSGTSQYELITPNVKISELKSLFAILFDSGDYYHWSEDSLSHKTSADGTQGAGGEYHYKRINGKLKVSILYTD